jgi:hypothetical protein
MFCLSPPAARDGHALSLITRRNLRVNLARSHGGCCQLCVWSVTCIENHQTALRPPRTRRLRHQIMVTWCGCAAVAALGDSRMPKQGSSSPRHRRSRSWLEPFGFGSAGPFPAPSRRPRRVGGVPAPIEFLCPWAWASLVSTGPDS